MQIEIGKQMRVSSTVRSNLAGSSRKPGTNGDEHPGHEDLDEHRDDGDHDNEPAHDARRPRRARLRALLLERFGKERNEGGVERTLGEQAAEQIGEAEGREIGVGRRAGAEHRRDERVADEAEDARAEREHADD